MSRALRYLLFSAAVLVVACGLCFWQNHLLLEIANYPLPKDVGVSEGIKLALKALSQ